MVLHRAQTSMVLATALYRGSHLVAGISAVLQHQRHHPVQWAMLGAVLMCSAVVFADARRRGCPASWAVWLDVLVTGSLLPFVAYAWGGARASESIAWVMLLGGSSAALATVGLRRRAAATAIVLLVVTHASGYVAVAADTAVIGAHLNALVFSAVISRVLWWYLRRQGTLLSAANDRALAAEAQRARYAERIKHHRALHDTVLATLTAIAGGVDAGTNEVRRRCAREAAYLRRLVEQTGDQEAGSEIFTALEESVRSAESLGLKVTARYHELPSVPADIARAMADAVTEALNNVRRHAGTGHAYMTVTGDSGRLTVAVVDQGHGLVPGRAAPGLGLTRSVHGRMREIGGRCTVDGAPGEGVSVELRWPG